MFVQETADVATEVMETVLFTKLSTELIDKAKVSQFLPIMRYVGAEWNFNISKNADSKTVRKIIINSIKNN